MGNNWHSSFFDAIAGPVVQLGFAVEVFRDALGNGVGGDGEVFSSVPLSGALTWLMTDDLDFGGQAVTPQTWSASEAAWRFSLATTDLVTVAPILRRGTRVRLKAGPPGNPWATWATIQWGQVQDVTYARGRVRVEVWGPTASLHGRADPRGEKTALFYNAGDTSTISGTAYTAGDPILYVADETRFERQTGGTGVVQVDPGGGTAPFYLTYTGSAAGQLTGVSALGQFGTTAVNAALGRTVTNIAYLYGRPDAIVAKVLTSTGAGTNGIYDVLPESSGLALPQEMVDLDDMVYDWGNNVLAVSSGAYSWDVLVAAPLTDALSWLAGLLSPIGLWLTQRQGQITLRMAQDARRGSVPVSSTIDVTDADWLGEPDHEEPAVSLFSGDVPAVYGSITVTAQGTASTSVAVAYTTLPAWLTQQAVNLDSVLWSNISAVVTSDKNRLVYWSISVPEEPSGVVAGCTHAALCPGDIVYLTSTRLRGGFQSTAYGYSQHPVMVAEITPDWIRGTTRLRLQVLPIDTDDQWLVVS